MRLLFWLLLFLLLPYVASAQISLYGGATASTVHSQYLVGDTQPHLGYQLGATYCGSAFQATSFRPGFSLELSQRGYTQEIDDIRHAYRLTYLIAYPHLSYFVRERWSVTTGIELNALIRARYRQGSERIGVIENYRGSDIGLRAELRWQCSTTFGIYAGYTHGLRNLVKYPNISDTGDFVGTIRDVNFRTAQIGFLITMFDYEK
ncbi:hypothetical protein [Tunicatimonas pelagia]|uniref:hypothetical protein n=1 Tax=Tunicatimonas pelagia TaxID=931531 RepID=UPI0026653DD9|nr:hypothetical protein [Tunicatimonas pelagia]WKN45197.1 hypothetical protein P0M28_09520 [Tunicatimonas pelagia]